MALAALETYFEDRLVEAVAGSWESHLSVFMRDSLANDLKYFHTPSADRVRPLFEKYLGVTSPRDGSGNKMEPLR